MDLAKATSNTNSDTDLMTGVLEEEFIDKQYLDPITFVAIKTEIKVSY
jgi:hypothetical protein